jgi:hypothetical protein
MKAERRHQLQNNTLAKVITGAPNWWQDAGGKMLAAAVVLLLIVLLVRYRISSNHAAQAKAADNLATARSLIEQIHQLSLYQSAPVQEIAVRRKTYMNDANNAIAEAMRLSDDRKVQAEALVAKGDLNWTLASQPVLPGAATQPSLQLGKDPKELKNLAAESYEAVLNNYGDLKYASVAARFGLAAIAEDRAEWDGARAQYEKIKAEALDGGAFAAQASARLRLLDLIRQPVILAPPTTAPAVAPAATAAPATSPLTAAAAGPAFVKPLASSPSATVKPATHPAATNAATHP